MIFFFCFIDLLIHEKNCTVTCRYSFKKKLYAKLCIHLMKKWQMVISFANVVFSFLNVYCVYIFLYHDNLSVPQYWICLSAVIYRCAIHLC